MRGNAWLARIQRNALIACAVFTAAAWLAGGRGAAAAVIGGGLLAAISFVLIKGGILDAAALDRESGVSPPPGASFAILKLTGRYALLGFLAYVMIARLRLHPLGLIAGASSVVAAAALEAGRLFRNNK